MSAVVRYPENLQPQERFISFVNCFEARNAASLAAAITDVLRSLNINSMVMVV